MGIIEDKIPQAEAIYNETDTGLQVDIFGNKHEAITHGKGQIKQLSLDDLLELELYNSQNAHVKISF